MSKVTIDPITSGYNLSKINANFVLLQDELNNNVLYRVNPSGEPNSLSNDIDMNSNDLLNAKIVDADVVKIGGVSVVPTGTTASTANAVSVTPAGSISSTDVQAAIEEIDVEHISNATDAHDASSISNVAAGDIVATDVQTAIDELDTDKVPRTSITGSAKLPTGTTAQRDGSPSSGWYRFNTDTGFPEVYNGGGWEAARMGGDLQSKTLVHNMTSDADYTLSSVENNFGRIVITDTGTVLTTGRGIIVADTERTIFSQNDTLQTITPRTLTGSGIAIPLGNKRLLLCNGTDVIEPASPLENSQLAGYPFAAVDDITGTWSLLESWTPTAIASKDFTWDESLYSQIKIVVEGVVPSTDNSVINCRLGYNNGATFFEDTNDYVVRISVLDISTLAEVTLASTTIPLSHNGVASDGVGSAAGEGFSAVFDSVGWGSLVSRPGFTYRYQYDDNAGAEISGSTWGQVVDDASDTISIDSFRLYWVTGNFKEQGVVKIYGLKAA